MAEAYSKLQTTGTRSFLCAVQNSNNQLTAGNRPDRGDYFEPSRGNELARAIEPS